MLAGCKANHEVKKVESSVAPVVEETNKQKFAMEGPSTQGNIVHADRKYYQVWYDLSKKCPVAVDWTISPKDGERKVRRAGQHFYTDTDITSADNSDYNRIGFDRGHMVPCEDMSFSKEAQTETFRMSNVCPQYPALNRGPWEHLEKALRDSAKSNTVTISAGPIWNSADTTVINGMTVPGAYWKVWDINGHKEGVICANTPNKDVNTCNPVSLDSIAKVSEGYSLIK